MNELKINRRGELVRYGIYLLFAVFYFWLAAQVPYTHDDWDWGLEVGLQQLLTASVNSRYVGNFFVVIMTRSELVKTLIMGSVSFALPLLMVKVAQGRGKAFNMTLYLCANFLLLTIERGIWRETYGWVSGFANYLISAVLMLACFNACSYVFYDTDPAGQKASPAVCIGALLTGVAVQLFLENLALYILLLFAVTASVQYTKTKRVSRWTVCALIGAVIGLIIMFSSSIYGTLLDTGMAVGSVRKLSISPENSLTGNIATLAYLAAMIVIKLFEYNLVLIIFILAIIALLLRRKKGLGYAAAAVNAVLCAYFLYNKITDARPNVWFEAAVNGISFLIVGAETLWLFSENKERLSRLLMAWVSGPILVLPIIVTLDQGPRLFFGSDVFMIVFALILLEDFLSGLGRKAVKALSVCGLAAVMAVSAFYVGLYRDIAACTVRREERIREAIRTDADTVYLPAHRYEGYLKCPDPDNDFRKYYFREFYGLGPDVEIVIEE